MAGITQERLSKNKLSLSFKIYTMLIFNYIAFFLAKNLSALHSGATVGVKILSSFKLGVSLALLISPITYLMDKLSFWWLINMDFVVVMIIIILIDWFIGTIYHGFTKQDFSPKKSGLGLLQKFGFLAVGALIFELLNFIVKDHSWALDSAQLVTRLTLFLWPAGSALMNMSEITHGAFPPIGWINKIKKFNKDLNVNSFQGQDNQPSRYRDNDTGYQDIPTPGSGDISDNFDGH